jgi:hypothetical protein
MQAGIHFETLYTLADQNNATYVGGYAATVGASGGWLAISLFHTLNIC